MADWDVFEYLLEGKRRGFSDWALKRNLLKNGFNEQRVSEAFYQLNNEKRINRKETFPALGTNNIYNFGLKKKSQENTFKTKDPPVLKKRNPLLLIIFSIITFGIYSVYWLVKTSNELRKNSVRGPNSWLLLFFLLPISIFGGLLYYLSFLGTFSDDLVFGILLSCSIIYLVFHLFYFWRYSRALNEFTGLGRDWIFVLWIFLPPVAMVVSQVKINDSIKN